MIDIPHEVLEYEEGADREHHRLLRRFSVETWFDLAQKDKKLAGILVKLGFYRATISRAYYAVYSKITDDLVKRGVSMPSGREGPEHHKLRSMIINHLTRMNYQQRQALSRLVGRLYILRLDADYRPSVLMDVREGREAFGLMNKVFDAF